MHVFLWQNSKEGLGEDLYTKSLGIKKKINTFLDTQINVATFSYIFIYSFILFQICKSDKAS